MPRRRYACEAISGRRACAVSRKRGNVRELNHVLRRALALGSGASIDVTDLFDQTPATIEAAAAEEPSRSLSDHLEVAERAFLIDVLHSHRGAITEAAARLGISRKTLWEKMRRHGIDKQQFGVERPVGAAVQMAG